MHDVIVVGGAAAGLTAALYTARQGLRTLVLTKDIGGQALLTPHIENYPGFEGISGFELTQKIQQQAAGFGAEFVYEEVKQIDETDNWFNAKTSSKEYPAKVVILAFGKTPRDLGVPGEERLVGRGVSYCAVCDAPLFRGRVTAVVGWGDPAVDAATMLCRVASRVYLIHRGAQLIANEEMMGKCLESGNVEAVPNSTVVEIRGDRVVEAIVVRDVKSGETKGLRVDGVFVELGYVAKTDFVRGLVQLNSAGEIIVDKSQATGRPGVFAAGDVTDTPFKQVIISAGEGAKAGLAAYNYIQRLRGKPALKADWKSLRK